MIQHSVRSAVISCGLLCGLPPAVVAQLHLVDEARQLSQATGRPIFAMAGNKT